MEDRRGARDAYDRQLVRVAFLLQDLQLSGGVGVIVEHAAQLRRHHGMDVRLVLARPRPIPTGATAR